MSFYNPYHFVPVLNHGPNNAPDPNRIPCPPGGDVTPAQLGHRTHDRYHPNTYSGRIVCTLETVTPTVIGGEQTSHAADDGYTRVHPFKRDGEPAIPASTLRGCLSSLAEAATNSALRVLEDEEYSRRVVWADMQGRIFHYSAMGMIVKQDGKLLLRPLALPTLEMKSRGYELHPAYRQMFPPGPAPLKAYCYNPSNLDTAPDSYSADHRRFYYAKLAGEYVINTDHTVTRTRGEGMERGPVFLGVRTVGDPVSVVPPGGQGYVKGILRVLSAPGQKDIPNQKKHEMFIPMESEEPPAGRLFPIDPKALNDFERLARGRDTENNRRKGTREPMLPYALKGNQDFVNRPAPCQYRLRDGDLVFFQPDSTGLKVAKVWVSQIWRNPIEGSAHKYFKKVDPELLPFNETRTTITPAEALFGFVEVEPKPDEPNRSEKLGLCDDPDPRDEPGPAPPKPQARALAGRIRFSEARLTTAPDGGCFENEVKTRILAGPKPPCPSFYFRPQTVPNQVNQAAGYVDKKDMSPVRFIPMGRKFYLNHENNESLIRRSVKTNKPEDSQKQKNIVKPLRPDCRFSFHIDFDNLSDWELGLLLWAVEPGNGFLHKIGMGKPLGLGSVRMKATGLFLIDRKARYGEDAFLDDPLERYSRYWTSEIQANDLAHLGVHEQAALRKTADPAIDPNQFKATFVQTMPPDLVSALTAIGQPYQRVMYPRAAGQVMYPELETFKWFMNNDRAPDRQRQGLVPLGGGRTIMDLDEV